jgi:hypothetical protein
MKWEKLQDQQKQSGMVTGLFRDRESAERAYGSLTDRGYDGRGQLGDVG